MTMTNQRNRTPARGGFTLLEAVLSMLVVSIILGAIGSLMVMTTRQLSASTGGAANLLRGNQLAQQITAELSVATSVTERTATAVTFTVPDRNGDGQPETIRYAWSGTPGNPVTRAYNGGTPANVAENVYAFSLDYLLKTVGP